MVLVLAQILSQSFTPKDNDSCVGVEFKGVTYKAAKAVRSRLTGRVVLTMLNQYPPDGRAHVIAARVKCGMECETRLCARECGPEPKTLFVPDESWGKCVDLCRPRFSVFCQSTCSTQFPLPELSPEPTPLPGRTISLAGADSITDSTSCSCPHGPASSCVDR